MLLKIREWWQHYRRPPLVLIEYSGQRTPSPKVHVSVAGLTGSQEVYTWDANEQGEACATLYGKGLADIVRRKLVDRRPHMLKPLKTVT